MDIGFIGAGRIAGALVEGLCATAPPGERIHLSPRGRETAARLAAAHPAVRVAPDNQAVADAAGVIFLSVRGETAEGVLRGLRLSPHHLLISVVAGLPLARLRALAPACTVVRAFPIPSVRRCQSPTALCPPEPRARALFDRLGTALELEEESALEAVAAATSLITPTFALLEEVARWLVGRGVPASSAVRFVLGQFHSMVGMAAESPEGGTAALAEGTATPGGLNEQATRFLREAGAFAAFTAALDAVLARLTAPQAPHGEPGDETGGTG